EPRGRRMGVRLSGQNAYLQSEGSRRRVSARGRSLELSAFGEVGSRAGREERTMTSSPRRPAAVVRSLLLLGLPLAALVVSLRLVLHVPPVAGPRLPAAPAPFPAPVLLNEALELPNVVAGHIAVHHVALDPAGIYPLCGKTMGQGQDYVLHIVITN